MTEAPYRFAGRVPEGVTPVVAAPGQESVWDYPRPPRVEAVPEGYDGGWVTSRIVGPMKGEPGSGGW